MTISKTHLALVSVYALMLATAEAQQLITVCGTSKGKAFYLEPKKDGWVDDGISGGTMTFVRYPSGQYDIIIKDSVRAISAREDGATVVKSRGSDDNVMTLIAAYSEQQVTEVYQLTLNPQGRGTLIWSSLKNRAGPIGITRGAVFVAECAR